MFSKWPTQVPLEITVTSPPQTQSFDMTSFQDLNLSKALKNAIDDLGFEAPTPIQEQSHQVILSGANMVGIAQTGTGKTLAYLLPLLQDLKFSKQVNPRILILVPTRELVMQVVEQVELLTAYMTVRVLGIYGGVNINTQKLEVVKGADIVVATPGRLYDLVLARTLHLKSVKKLVIDEVDVMLDLGFRFQLTNLFELLPEKRQNIMFSATMTEEVETLIEDFFIAPITISIAVSGTPLTNIQQSCYSVPNFYTKINLLKYILADKKTFEKVLLFAPSKKYADRIFAALEEDFDSSIGVIHANKSQNYRIQSIDQFNSGAFRILVTTDVMARGLDLDQISHVINFDAPTFPENYMHRIGRTGRAEHQGHSILLFTENEAEAKLAIEVLMNYEIPMLLLPNEVEISTELIPDERPRLIEKNPHKRPGGDDAPGPAFHEKKAKNRKVNQGGSYRREIAKKYKKAKTRGDKIANQRRKKK